MSKINIEIEIGSSVDLEAIFKASGTRDKISLHDLLPNVSLRILESSLNKAKTPIYDSRRDTPVGIEHGPALLQILAWSQPE